MIGVATRTVRFGVSEATPLLDEDGRYVVASRSRERAPQRLKPGFSCSVGRYDWKSYPSRWWYPNWVLPRGHAAVLSSLRDPVPFSSWLTQDLRKGGSML